MTTAFLFPGQGSERPGMGGAALESPLGKQLLARASQALGVELSQVIARGSPLLARTEIGQPALVAVCLALSGELERAGHVPDVVAGHSVGELAAFAVSGHLAPEDAIDAAVERGRLMARAAKQRPGGMFALRREADVAPALAAGAPHGALELAAHNSPGEWVLTGDRAALAAVTARFEGTRLPVAGPWHSRAMAEAEDRWRTWLERIAWCTPRCPVVINATGDLLGDAHPAGILASQLTRPVRWATSLETLARAGVSELRVVGPGRVLRGLCRANLGNSIPIEVDDGVAEPASSSA